MKYREYNARERELSGFNNNFDHSIYKHHSHPEYQDECQYVDQKNEFESWFFGNEIRGDFRKACEALKDKIFSIIDQNVLFDAYFHKEEPKRMVDNTVEQSSDDCDDNCPF